MSVLVSFFFFSALLFFCSFHSTRMDICHYPNSYKTFPSGHPVPTPAPFDAMYPFKSIHIASPLYIEEPKRRCVGCQCRHGHPFSSALRFIQFYDTFSNVKIPFVVGVQMGLDVGLPSIHPSARGPELNGYANAGVLFISYCIYYTI